MCGDAYRAWDPFDVLVEHADRVSWMTGDREFEHLGFVTERREAVCAWSP